MTSLPGSEGQPPQPSWQNHEWTPELRRRFAIAYLIYGLMLMVVVLETIDALERHNRVIAFFPGGLAAVLVFYVGRMAYRQMWHERRRWRIRHGTLAPPSISAWPRDGAVITKGWIWDAVWTHHALTEQERPAAQATAVGMAWGPWRRIGNIVGPGGFALWIVAHLIAPEARTPVQTVLLILGLVMVVASQGLLVMQARLRRWMRANDLST